MYRSLWTIDYVFFLNIDRGQEPGILEANKDAGWLHYRGAEIYQCRLTSRNCLQTIEKPLELVDLDEKYSRTQRS